MVWQRELPLSTATVASFDDPDVLACAVGVLTDSRLTDEDLEIILDVGDDPRGIVTDLGESYPQWSQAQYPIDVCTAG